MAKNEWENDDSHFLQALHSVYKRIWTILFPYLLAILFKQRYISTSVLLKVINI